MELEMQWDGNPNIVLDIKTLVGVGLPIQVLSKNYFTSISMRSTKYFKNFISP